MPYPVHAACKEYAERSNHATGSNLGHALAVYPQHLASQHLQALQAVHPQAGDLANTHGQYLAKHDPDMVHSHKRVTLSASRGRRLF